MDKMDNDLVMHPLPKELERTRIYSVIGIEVRPIKSAKEFIDAFRYEIESGESVFYIRGIVKDHLVSLDSIKCSTTLKLNRKGREAINDMLDTMEVFVGHKIVDVDIEKLLAR